MQTTYKEMAIKLSSRRPFKGNSVEAKYDDYNNYVVSSYGTNIYSSYGTVQNYFDNKYYSVTTSKIQNMIIDVFGLNDGKRKRD